MQSENEKRREIGIAEAVEVFVHGFGFTRSFTFPYHAEQIAENVWVLRDAPRTRGNYRTEEYVGYDVAPAALDTLARQHTRGHYRLCVARRPEESDLPLRTQFKALGYRLMTTEAFMAHRLTQIPCSTGTIEVKRVTTLEQAEALAKAARSRQILPEHLGADPSPLRQYMVMAEGKPVGWVGSVAVAGCAWCTNMFVDLTYRRRGVATALLTRMLTDDRAAGARANVLLASHAGARLYPVVGYEQMGELLVYGITRKTA